MSKKFGINTKSAEARARKDAVKQANERDKQQKLEDEFWRDDDKHVQKKLQRKVRQPFNRSSCFQLIFLQDNKEQNEQEKLLKRQEAQQLLEQEEASLTSSKAKTKPDLALRKVTQAQIQQHQAAAAAGGAATTTAVDKTRRNNLPAEDLPIEENVNRLKIDGASARNVDDAINVLQSSNDIVTEKHPEKRMKAAYETYEAENLPKLKEEHPTLRLSQLKQILKKDWMKAPENPFNKPTKAYNEPSKQKQLSLPEEKDSDDDN